MKILVIGATGFIGPHVVRDLQKSGHTIAVLHRGKTTTQLPAGVQEIKGDRNHAADLKAAIASYAPGVVVDIIPSSGKQAEALMQAARGIARRVVAVSSMDVYRAFAIVNGIEQGPLEVVPLTEDSALRRNPPYPPERLQMLKSIFTWVNNEYDKVSVERAIMSDPDLPGTVLRLPMVYGARDPLHRLFPLLKRMDDRRPKILLQADHAAWHGARGYVENVAAAIALATTSDRAVDRIYNIVEEPDFSEFRWAKLVAEQAEWYGEFVVLPRERLPKHLQLPGNFAQHANASSRRIRRELGYDEAVQLDVALQRTIEWERAHPPAQAELDYAAEDDALAA